MLWLFVLDAASTVLSSFSDSTTPGREGRPKKHSDNSHAAESQGFDSSLEMGRCADVLGALGAGCQVPACVSWSEASACTRQLLKKHEIEILLSKHL